MLAAACAALAATSARAAPITEGEARAFLGAQERLWNAGRIADYFAAYTPDARFTDQAYVGDKPPVSYGTSTLDEARAQARRAFARGRPQEAGRVIRIDIAADGASARATLSEVATIPSDGHVRRLCATRVQSLVRVRGRLKSRGQVDTYARCRP